MFQKPLINFNAKSYFFLNWVFAILKLTLKFWVGVTPVFFNFWNRGFLGISPKEKKYKNAKEGFYLIVR